MIEVALLQKVYGEVSLEILEEFLRETCEGLKVSLTDFGVVESGWVKAVVSGEDEIAAVRFLDREVGLAPATSENVERFSVLQGKVIFSGKSKTQVSVDVGVFSPKPVYATISLQRLQAQLVDGRKIPLEQISELFGIVDTFPLQIRIVEIGEEEFEGELTENQLELYRSLIDSRVDRLIVLGALDERVETAVRRARLTRDVLRVDQLGLFIHVLVCKLGTDATGLIPKLGMVLPKASFLCFSPRRILKLISGRW